MQMLVAVLIAASVVGRSLYFSLRQYS